MVLKYNGMVAKNDKIYQAKWPGSIKEKEKKSFPKLTTLVDGRSEKRRVEMAAKILVLTQHRLRLSQSRVWLVFIVP